MSQNQKGWLEMVGSFMLLLLKIAIGIFMVPGMALWQGLKFFRRHVYSKGSWLLEISGAVSGIAGGIALARDHVAEGSANSHWWIAAGFALALAIYVYAFPAIYWVLIRPIVPYVKAFFKNSFEFLRLLCVDILRAIRWFIEKFIWAPICWTWKNIVYPVLRFIWVDVICRLASFIRWCWNTFWHVVRVCIEKFIDVLDFLWTRVLVPVWDFSWTYIIKPFGRAIRYCWKQFCRAVRWTWTQVIVPSAKFAWKHIIVPLAEFTWNKILVPLWSFACKCARQLKRAFFWTIDNIVVPTLRFIWEQIICRIGRFIKSCWNLFWKGVHWVFDNVICRTLRFVWEEIVCRIGRAIRWLWNSFVATPIQWVWRKIVHPIVTLLWRGISKVWNYLSTVFVSSYYSTSTTTELISHLLGLCIPIGMIAIYIGTAPMLSKLWLMLIAVPAIAAVPLAYVWGGKALRLGGNWINGFALSFSSAYLIGLAASQFVSLQSAVEIGSGAGILLFFVLYPLLFGGWERLTQGSRFELAILGLLKAGFARADSEVSVISGLCVEVWVYLQNTVPDFLYRTWTDTWNWIQRVFRRFGG